MSKGALCFHKHNKREDVLILHTFLYFHKFFCVIVVLKLVGALQLNSPHDILFYVLYSLLAPVAFGCCNDYISPQGSVIIIVSSCAHKANKVMLIH